MASKPYDARSRTPECFKALAEREARVSSFQIPQVQLQDEIYRRPGFRSMTLTEEEREWSQKFFGFVKKH